MTKDPLDILERLTAGDVSKDLARIIAFCLSDGTVSRRKANKGESFTVMFFNKDKKLHEIFNRSIENIFNIKPKILPNKRCLSSIVHSKNVVLTLIRISNSFRTKACNSFPVCPVWSRKAREGSCFICKPISINGTPFPAISFDWLEKAREESVVEFFKVLFSCDGGVSIWISNGKTRREVMLGCAHPILLDKFKEKLENLLKVKIGKKDNGLRINSLEAIKRFRDKIGFIEGCVAERGKFKGIEKNILLNHAILGSLPAGRKPCES
jgi:hypothetical protein